MLAFVVTAEMAAAIKARAEQELHTVSGWLRCAAATALVAEDEATDAKEMVR